MTFHEIDPSAHVFHAMSHQFPAMKAINQCRVLWAAAILIISVAGCERAQRAVSTPKPATAGGIVKSDRQCLTAPEVERLRKEPVSSRAVMRLATHYGICLYDAEGALAWLRVGVAKGYPDAMTELANQLENRSPANSSEVAALRQRAAASAKKNPL